MTFTLTRTVATVSSLLVFAFAAALAGCSGTSAARMAERLEMQREQWRLDRQELAGFEGGLARSLQPAVYAESEADALATLLPGGESAFPPLSVALWRDYRAPDYGTAQPDLGSAYVQSVSGDGAGGFRVIFVIDGRESSSHFPVHLFSADNFSGSAEDNALVPYLLWSWTDSFEADADGPATTDRTTGSSLYDYFDINGWQAGGALIGNFRGFMTYGAVTRAENLPTGSAIYEGRLDAEIWRADSWEWGSRSPLRGTIYLEADFAAGEIGGRIGALHIQRRAADAFQLLPEGNTIDIESGPINEARITAQWVGNDTNANAPPHETIHGFSGTLIGDFYGPRADEAGGVLSGRRAPTTVTPEQFLMGAFGASRSDPGD